jgi:predicted RNA binding protein YcfA (HicA-like mRNA interferase family)
MGSRFLRKRAICSPRESLDGDKGWPRLASAPPIGWRLKRQAGSHRVLARGGWPDFVFAFHDSDEIGPRMLARLAKHTDLRPEDL